MLGRGGVRCTIVSHHVNLVLISPLMAPSRIACQSQTISSPISGVAGRRFMSQLPSLVDEPSGRNQSISLYLASDEKMSCSGTAVVCNHTRVDAVNCNVP